MKMLIVVLSVIASLGAFAAPDSFLEVENLRGADIQAEAGNCDVGPFGVDGDTGAYDGMCHKLTMAEKCLAFIKQHIGQDGAVSPAYDTAKVSFCMTRIKNGMSATQ